MRALLCAIAAVAVVRRTVDQEGQLLALAAGQGEALGAGTAGDEQLLKDCTALTEELFGTTFEKTLGGAGSNAVVFKTTAGTVIKCGTGDNLRLEADALQRLQHVEGVVDLKRKEEKNGHILLELEFLTAMTWKECIGSGECADAEGRRCSSRSTGCFPVCRKEWGNGDLFFETPLTYVSARDLIGANIRAFHSVCEAAFSQANSTSGMNTMVTSAGEVKLIDFEKGHELGHWHGGLWCNHDQRTMKERIDEVTRCLDPEDPFRVEAALLGDELKAWDSSPVAKGLWKKDDPEKIAAAQAADIEAAREVVEAMLAKAAALPVP